MINYSISAVVSQLKEGTDKVYLTTYREHGYELGFGKGGSYPGHSHLYFQDIFISYEKIQSSDAHSVSIRDTLLLIPPQTYLGDVVCGDFFFIKFCPSQETVVFPEKVDDVMTKGTMIHTSSAFEITFPFYKSKSDGKQEVKVQLKDDVLLLTVGSDEYKITP